MLNRLRHLLKKQKLAVSLARCDLLFLINGLASFKTVIKPARFFVKPSPQPIPCRVQKFLASRKGYFPDLLLSELSALSLSRGAPLLSLPLPEQAFSSGSVMVRENLELCDASFYLGLLQELVQTDFPRFADGFSDFKSRLPLAEDMRLFAAELEHIMSLSADSPACFSLQVDWIKTTDEKLYLEAPEDFKLTSALSSDAQKNFAALFAHLLFEKSAFVSDWQTVAVADSRRIALVDFDKIYNVAWRDKLFALQPEAKPDTWLQLKLRRALLLLQSFCPEVNLSKVFAPYRSSVGQQGPFVGYDKNFLRDWSAYGYAPQITKADSPAGAGFISRLLKPKPPETSWMDKSAIFYWGPLIIAAFVLFIIFRI